MCLTVSSPVLRVLVASAILGLNGVSGCAVAAAGPPADTRSVRFADLDLSKPQDAHALYRRIRAAAQVVCSQQLLITDADKARCESDAIRDAVVRVNHPALSAVFEGR